MVSKAKPDKFKLLSAIIAALNEQLASCQKAAKDAAQAATHAESVAETKWDTFGLESSYLAHGQQKRVAELKQSLSYYKNLSTALAVQTTPKTLQVIANSSLITLENLDDDNVPDMSFFLGTYGGGVKVTVDGLEFTVITTQSPIGQSLLGKGLGDEVTLKLKGQSIVYEVAQID